MFSFTSRAQKNKTEQKKLSIFNQIWTNAISIDFTVSSTVFAEN